MSTKIEWTQESWNPIVGCSKVSPGCKNCYAERMAKRLKAMGVAQYQNVVDEKGWTGEILMSPGKTLQIPWHWENPRMIFVCSMSDLFHEQVKFEWIDTIFITIKSSPQHTFQILTKRAERMAEYFSTRAVPDNVWVGVTAEDQQRADERIPYLLQVKAKVRFVSVEPMLGPVELWAFIGVNNGIHWVICGGESGTGARPMNPDWARRLRDQCRITEVPFFLKQMKVDGKMVKMPTLDGEVWDQIPERRAQCITPLQ